MRPTVRALFFGLVLGMVYLGPKFLLEYGPETVRFGLAAVLANEIGADASGHYGDLRFERVSHDLGVVDAGETQESVFAFVNRGTTPVRLTRSWSSCGCTAVQLPTDPIAPGARGTVRTRIDTSDRHGTFRAYAKVFSDQNPETPQLLIVDTVVRQSLILRPSSLSITRAEPGTPLRFEIEMETAPGHQAALAAKQPADVHPTLAPDGASLSVEIEPPAIAGEYVRQVEVIVTASETGKTRRRKLPVAFNVLEPFAALDPEVRIAGQRGTLRLSKNWPKVAHVTSYRCSDATLRLRVEMDTPRYLQVEVLRKENASVRADAAFVIETDSAQQPTLRIPIRLAK
jgi:Protein of unknown function (DUF1573)